ncbi:unknown [Collinsella sp. CAG:398]|nr:unknown [Collinsella sp. CAG:398]
MTSGDRYHSPGLFGYVIVPRRADTHAPAHKRHILHTRHPNMTPFGTGSLCETLVPG